jgi:hypothetical protein
MNRRYPLLAVLAATFVSSAPAMANDDRDASSWRSLTGQWWQWALSTPAAANQVLDSSGAACMVGQRGPVWFLAGSFSGQPTVRTCSVPDNVSLFFPVINSVNFNTPGCSQPDVDYTMADLRALVAPPIDGATGLSVLLDNRPVPGVRRVRSDAFSVTLPPGNIFAFWDPATCIVAGQVYSPAADDGYYARLHPLRAGQHHLSIRGTDANGFLVDVFYTLNVISTTTR